MRHMCLGLYLEGFRIIVKARESYGSFPAPHYPPVSALELQSAVVFNGEQLH